MAGDGVLPTEASDGFTSGQVDADLSITPDGAATYRIPLWVPPGRNGVQPDLALQYDSRSGYGVMGVGWSLNGIPQITRCRKTFGLDGRTEPVLFDGSDPFCLGGERLLLAPDANGVKGAEYRTRRETFTKILVRDADPFGPLAFVAYQGDGRVLTFEADPATEYRVLATAVPGNPDPDGISVDHVLGRYSWSLRTVVDRSGNMFEVSYGLWNGDGEYPQPAGAAIPVTGVEFLPEEIRYTGSTDPEGPLPVRSVRFFYGKHPSRQVQYVSGLRIKRAARLERIEMWGPGAGPESLLRLYEITYRDDSITGRSLVATVRECDGWPTRPALPGRPVRQPPAGAKLGVSKRPHVFDWELGELGYDDYVTDLADVKSTPGGRSRLPGRLLTLDLDGDGRDDLLFVQASMVDRYVFALARKDSSGFGQPQPTALRLPQSNGRPGVLDYDLDGSVDLLTFDDRKIIPGTGAGALNVLSLSRTDPASGMLELESLLELAVELAEVADLDGDGRADLLTSELHYPPREQRSWSYRLRSKGGFAEPVVLDKLLADDHRLLDLDGDGAIEVLSAYLLDPNGRRYQALRLGRPAGSALAASYVTTLRADKEHVFADFNGDGLVDALAHDRAYGSSVTSLLTNGGDGFLPPEDQALTKADLRTAAIRVIDYDGDGRKELLVRDHEYGSPLYVLRVDDDKLVEVALPFRSKWLDEEDVDVFEVLDVNGDGLDDFVALNDGFLHLYVHRGKKPDLMTGVRDPLGSATGIRYEPVTEASVYRRTQLLGYPLYPLTARRSVVAEVATDDGLGGANHYLYAYEDGHSDLRGQGFLGFVAHEVTHVESGTKTRTSFDLETTVAGQNPLAGVPVKVATHTPLEAGVERVRTLKTAYEVRPGAAPGSLFTFARKIEDTEQEIRNGAATTIRRVTTSQDFDDYGNLTMREDIWPDGSRETYRALFTPRVDEWLTNLVELTTTESAPAGQPPVICRVAFEYDAEGRLRRRIIEPGQKTANGYQPLGPQPDGVTTLYLSFTRNPGGTIARVALEDTTGPAGEKRTTSYRYDNQEQMFPVEVTNDLGHTIRASYHAGLGLPKSVEDANGMKTSYQYDGFGRIRRQSAPGATDRTFSYLPPVPAGLQFPGSTLTAVADAGGPESLTVYDWLGRPFLNRSLTRDDGRAVLRSRVYDERNRVTRASRPYFEGSQPIYDTYTYDNLDRVISETRADGAITSVSYAGRGSTVVDGEKRGRSSVKDDRGRIIRRTDRIGGRRVNTTYEYGHFDRLTRMTDSEGNATVLHYDRLGRLIEHVDPDSGARTMRRGAFGELLEETAGAQIGSYLYDPIGRLVEISGADGKTRFDWDPPHAKGRVARLVATDDVITSYRHDAFGRVSAMSWEVAGEQYDFELGYDNFGRVSRLAYPRPADSQQRFQLGFEYGAYGQPKRVVDLTSGLAYWTLLGSDASDAFTEELFADGSMSTRVESPNKPGRLEAIKSTTSEGQPIQELTFGFDGSGNLTDRSDIVLGTQEHFGYDSVNRLVSWTRETGAGQQQLDWTYDASGNLTQVRVNAGPGADTEFKLGAGGRPHAVSASSIGAYQYDERGNQTEAPGRTTAYTQLDLPRAITSGGHVFGFQYDGLGRRVRTYDGDGHEVISIAGLYRRHDGNLHVYSVPANGRIVAEVQQLQQDGATVSDETLFLYVDNLGSLDVVAGDGVVERVKYEPFGRRMNPAEPSADIPERTRQIGVGFAGHTDEEAIGLVDMFGRWYDPQSSRFVSADLIHLAPDRGQALNPYSYVHNNPLTWRDPSGFQTEGGDEANDDAKHFGVNSCIAASDLDDSWSRLDACVDQSHGSSVSGPATSAGSDDGFGNAGVNLPPAAPALSGARGSLNGVLLADTTPERLRAAFGAATVQGMRYDELKRVAADFPSIPPYTGPDPVGAVHAAASLKPLETLMRVFTVAQLTLAAVAGLGVAGTAALLGWGRNLTYTALLAQAENIGEIYVLTNIAGRSGFVFNIGRLPDLAKVAGFTNFTLQLRRWSLDLNWAAVQGYIDAGGRFLLRSELLDIVSNPRNLQYQNYNVTFLELMQIVSQGHQTF